MNEFERKNQQAEAKARASNLDLRANIVEHSAATDLGFGSVKIVLGGFILQASSEIPHHNISTFIESTSHGKPWDVSVNDLGFTATVVLGLTAIGLGAKRIGVSITSILQAKQMRTEARELSTATYLSYMEEVSSKTN